jgi:flavin-dependent dehydrogenase
MSQAPPSLDTLCKQTWPAVIVGAGPAGTLSALLLAREGIPVLLVDKARFPRPKVCGACLDGRALEILGDVGLGYLLRRLHAVSLQRLMLACRRRIASVPMARSVALSREVLDQALVDEAVQAGATFLPQTSARVSSLTGSHCVIRLQRGSLSRQVAANVVLAADGLNGGLLADVPGWNCTVHARSWIGAGTALQTCQGAYEAGTLSMALSRAGYVGLVKLEDGRLNVAAAFSANALRSAGGPGRLAQAILAEAGMEPIDRLHQSHWRGTPALSRRPQSVALHRILVLGDAAGYVEPLTGEGIGWALSAARAIIPFAIEGCQQWRPSLAIGWTRAFQEAILTQQTMCRFVTTLARYPYIVSGLEQLLEKTPPLGRTLMRRLNLGIT